MQGAFCADAVLTLFLQKGFVFSGFINLCNMTKRFFYLAESEPILPVNRLSICKGSGFLNFQSVKNRFSFSVFSINRRKKAHSIKNFAPFSEKTEMVYYTCQLEKGGIALLFKICDRKEG